MEIRDSHVVVTGGGSGLGEALCRAFAVKGASVVVADIDPGRARAVADDIGGLAVQADVGVEADIRRLVDEATARFGPVDLFYSNAGIGGAGDVFADDDQWQAGWQVHVMSNVYAARVLLPDMLARGRGYLVSTASATALTSQPRTAGYVVSKTANLALCETLALDYWEQGIRVSCVCPLGMRTNMLRGDDDQIKDATAKFGESTVIPAEVAADRILEGIEEERFLILTHPEVQTYFQRKASDHERWLAGMRRLYAKLADA